MFNTNIPYGQSSGMLTVIWSSRSSRAPWSFRSFRSSQSSRTSRSSRSSWLSQSSQSSWSSHLRSYSSFLFNIATDKQTNNIMTYRSDKQTIINWGLHQSRLYLFECLLLLLDINMLDIEIFHLWPLWPGGCCRAGGCSEMATFITVTNTWSWV